MRRPEKTAIRHHCIISGTGRAGTSVTSVKVVENPGEPPRVMGQAACEVMLSSGSVWAASIRENASTCM
jgi:hypothetical protein